MTDPLILVLSMSMSLIASVGRKFYTQKSPGGASDAFKFSAVSSLLSALTLAVLGGFGQVSLFTCLLGCAFGVVTMLQSIAQMRALETGPMSYTMVMMYFSTVISAVSGALFWNEQIKLAHVIGIVLMLISFVLAVKKQPGEKGVSLRWLLLSLGAFLCTGGIGVMQKFHQSTPHKGELNEFLVIAFGVSTLISGVYWAAMAKKERPAAQQNALHIRWLLPMLMAVCGIAAALNNKWNLYLSGVMDSAVFFPLVNGGGLVLTTLAAVLIFREKLSGQQWLGILFGIASVVFLCAPF